MNAPLTRRGLKRALWEGFTTEGLAWFGIIFGGFLLFEVGTAWGFLALMGLPLLGALIYARRWWNGLAEGGDP